MNTEEWINIGLKNGIIDNFDTACNLSMSFCDVYKSWFNNKMGSVRPQTLDRIETTYKKYYKNSFLNDYNVFDITDDILITFFNNYYFTKREYTRVKQIVLGVFDFLIIRDYKINSLNWKKISSYVPLCKINQKNKWAVPDKDIEYLFNSVINDKVYFLKQSGCLCLLLNFSLGLRIGELASLTWDCIDFENKVLYVDSSMTKHYERNESGERTGRVLYSIDTTKTESGIRSIPLTDKALYVLNLILEHHKNMGYHSPFLAYDGRNVIFLRSLDRTLRRLCFLTGVEYFESHRIRKTFASKLHRKGVPLKTISFLIGHSDLATTEKNYILNTFDSMEQLRLEINKIV